MKKSVLMAVLLGIFHVAAAFAQPSGVTNGINYLLSTQSSDGSWTSPTTTGTLPATVTVMEALRAVGQRETSTFSNAASWLSGQPIRTTDYLAERIYALAKGDSDNITLLSYLNRLSYTWGGYNGYGVNTLDTAQALQALKAADFTDRNLLNSILNGSANTQSGTLASQAGVLSTLNDLANANVNPDLNIIRSALNTLSSIQNADGGWGFRSGDDSSIYTTAVILQTMALYKGEYDLAASMNKAVSYLLLQQPSAEVYESAHAVIALVAAGQGQSTPLQNAVDFLIGTQAANGSWNDDPYSTALAVRALALVKPDLAIAVTDIAVTPAVPTADGTLTVTATVHNNGLEAAGNVTVRLVDNGATVADQTIASVISGGTGLSTFTISPLTPAGEHVLSVVVDPANAIEETNKANNTATSRIWAKTQPDLAVLPENLTISPAYPKPGDSITLTAAIANMGESAAGSFSADLYDGDPNSGGIKLGSFTLPGIAGGEWGTGTVTFSFAAEGAHTLYLAVDSLHEVNELITANNSASKAITISTAAGSFFDLSIPMNGIQFNPARPHAGDSATVTLLARNEGAETTTADLELFDGDPATGGTLLHKSVVTLSVGETRTVSVPWTISAGIHTLRVYMDRGNVVAERDETNNSQSLTVMADMVDIEISASDMAIEPEHPMDGDPATVKLTIQNRGIKATGLFNVNLYNGDPNNGGTLLQTFPIADLAGDGSQTITYPFTAARGTYRFHVVCDPEKVVAEFSEDNNLAIRSLLVKSSAEAMGPDLVPLELDLSATTTDPQTLRISGIAKVKFQNKGDDKITTPFRVTVFEDKDKDGVYTEGTDLSLGSADYTVPMNPNMVGVVPISLSGTLTFRDSPIYAMVDSGQVVFEQVEVNNTIRKGSACEARPVNPIEPVLEWKWPKTQDPTLGRILSNPVVISLTDDNGDGRIDNRDKPSVLVNAAVSIQTAEGKIWSFKGDTGDVNFTRYVAGQAPYEGGVPAVGDLDGDGKPEIIIKRRLGEGLLALAHDGSLTWDNSAQVTAWRLANPFFHPNMTETSIPSLADLDGDGHPEIVVGSTVMNWDGSVRCARDSRLLGGTGAGNGFGHSVSVADLDMDGKQEIVAGNTAYNNNCTIRWKNNSVTDGLTAVGDFDDDAFPEIVLLNNYVSDVSPTSSLYLLDHNGQIKWGPVHLKNLEPTAKYASYGGQPTIADFDGDGKAEVGIRGESYYFILVPLNI